MNTRSKLLSLVLAALMLLTAFAGCTGKPEPVSNTDEPVITDEPVLTPESTQTADITTEEPA